MSRSTDGRNGADRLRGYHPDLLVVDNMVGAGKEIDDEIIEQVLLPMFVTSGCDLWINDTHANTNDPLVEAVISDGAYVKKI